MFHFFLMSIVWIEDSLVSLIMLLWRQEVPTLPSLTAFQLFSIFIFRNFIVVLRWSFFALTPLGVLSLLNSVALCHLLVLENSLPFFPQLFLLFHFSLSSPTQTPIAFILGLATIFYMSFKILYLFSIILPFHALFWVFGVSALCSSPLSLFQLHLFHWTHSLIKVQLPYHKIHLT